MQHIFHLYFFVDVATCLRDMWIATLSQGRRAKALDLASQTLSASPCPVTALTLISKQQYHTLVASAVEKLVREARSKVTLLFLRSKS